MAFFTMEIGITRTSGARLLLRAMGFHQFEDLAVRVQQSPTQSSNVVLVLQTGISHLLQKQFHDFQVPQIGSPYQGSPAGGDPGLNYVSSIFAMFELILRPLSLEGQCLDSRFQTALVSRMIRIRPI